jgi:hypothetical protein
VANYKAAGGGTMVRTPEGQMVWLHAGASIPDYVTGPQLTLLLENARVYDDQDRAPDDSTLEELHEQLRMLSSSRAGRASTSSIAGGAAVTVTVSFATFADLDYTAAVTVEDGNGDLQVRSITARTASSVSVRVANLNTLIARTGTVHVLATHD